jgi:hypothetical protein
VHLKAARHRPHRVRVGHKTCWHLPVSLLLSYLGFYCDGRRWPDRLRGGATVEPNA